MNKDYLWDKTGEDAEIERLETILQSLSYKETAAPLVPELLTAKVLPFEQNRSRQPARRTFRGAYAVAACLAFIAVALGVGFQVLRSETAANQDSATIIESQKTIVPTENGVSFAERETISANDAVKAPSSSIAQKPEILKAKTVEKPKQFAMPKTAQTVKNIQTTVFRKDAGRETARAAKPAVKLTAEERYAYDQLRLALSITGSKLKMVKNKAESVEEKAAEGKGER